MQTIVSFASIAVIFIRIEQTVEVMLEIFVRIVDAPGETKDTGVKIGPIRHIGPIFLSTLFTQPG